MAGATFYQSVQTPTYASTVTVSANTLYSGNNERSAVPGINFTPSAATSPAVTTAAASSLQAAPSSVVGTTEATVDSESGLLTFTSTSDTPERAQAIADAYAKSFVAELQKNADAYIAQAEGQITELTTSIGALQAQVTLLPTNALFKAQLDDAIQKYSALSTQIDDIRGYGPPASVSVSASPGTQTSLSLTIVLALAALAGILAGAGLALIRDMMDGRIRSGEDVGIEVDVPMLVALPAHHGSSRDRYPLPVLGASTTPLVESVRSLRTVLAALVSRPSGAVLAVTSPRLGDGKTFVAANLAVSFAQSGKRTALLFGDLRKPDIGAYFDHLRDQLPHEPEGDDVAALGDEDDTRGTGGTVTGAIADSERTDSSTEEPEPEPAGASQETATPLKVPSAPGSLEESGIENLFLVRELLGPDERADALASEGVQSLLEKIDGEVDVVIIDTPPVLTVADAVILGGYADGMVVVAAARRTRPRELRETLARLEAGNTRPLGVVLNRVQGASGLATATSRQLPGGSVAPD